MLPQVRTIALALVLALTAAGTAAAQHSSEKTRIEVRDGDVYINGERVEDDDARIIRRMGEDGNIVIELEEDGKRVFINRGGVGGGSGSGSGDLNAWMHRYEDAPEPRTFHLEDLRERMHEGLFFGDEDNEFTFALGDGMNRFFARDMMFMDREQRELERAIQDKAREVRRSADEDREDLEAELDALLAEAFEHKLSREQEELSSLEMRLQELEERIVERRASRDRIIERRKRTLMGERDVLDW